LTTSDPEITTFVDTNVLVYAYDRSETVKHPIASALLTRLWDERTGVISTQVLQEFYAVATNKLKLAMAPVEAREIIEQYSAWPVVLLDTPLILNASRIHEQESISWWDAMIVEAAHVAGAARLVTEDMGDGREIEGVRIVNPFRLAGVRRRATGAAGRFDSGTGDVAARHDQITGETDW
jgi:predicted nucleic acid-binding protein